MNRRIRSTLILGILAVAAPAAAQETPGGQAAPVDLTVATRPAEDRARDEFFKPIEVFEWIGVEPGDVVLDFHAGSGYNTWILSQWVGPQGVVFTESPEQYAEDLKIRLDPLRDAKAAGIVLASIFACIGLAANIGGPNAGVLVLAIAVAGTFLWQSLSGRTQKAAQVAARRQVSYARSRWRMLVRRWNEECSTAVFNAEIARLRAVREQLEGWEGRRRRELRHRLQ